MKYIKTYENQENEYNSGDLIILDTEQLIKTYRLNSNITAVTFLKKINPLQRLYKQESGEYYIISDLWITKSHRFYIQLNEIKRKANKKELDKYNMKQQINKYNV